METVRNALKFAGLTERESDVYLLLGKRSFLTGVEVSKILNMNKAQAYTILTKLQEKRMIEATVGTPTRYCPIDIAVALDEIIRVKRLEADSIAGQRDELLAFWRRMQPAPSASSQERYATLPTRRAFQSKILDMINTGKHEIQLVLTTGEVIQADNAGVFEALKQKLMTQPDFRAMILAPILTENKSTVKTAVKTTKNKKLEWRHADIDSMNLSPLVMSDGEQVCIIPGNLPGDSSATAALWTNGNLVTKMCSVLFAELWRGKLPAEQRIREIETRNPSTINELIDDPTDARRRFVNIIRNAKREVTHLLPSKCFLEDEELRSFWKMPVKGVSVRAMVPHGAKLRTGKRPPEHWAFKDPNVNYLAISAIDRCHVFKFNVPTENADTGGSDYFRGMLYTNDPKQVLPICQMLDGLWDRAEDMPYNKRPTRR
ncbi:MAG TPA: helix-turn-helix domain-containing protein [Candidatus Acidoferrales bacterium]|nr:helix-turn-helix domain-containing protein [Candidatus Acidoferrales bacterium]